MTPFLKGENLSMYILRTEFDLRYIFYFIEKELNLSNKNRFYRFRNREQMKAKRQFIARKIMLLLINFRRVLLLDCCNYQTNLSGLTEPYLVISFVFSKETEQIRCVVIKFYKHRKLFFTLIYVRQYRYNRTYKCRHIRM